MRTEACGEGGTTLGAFRSGPRANVPTHRDTRTVPRPEGAHRGPDKGPRPPWEEPMGRISPGCPLAVGPRATYAQTFRYRLNPTARLSISRSRARLTKWRPPRVLRAAATNPARIHPRHRSRVLLLCAGPRRCHEERC